MAAALLISSGSAAAAEEPATAGRLPAARPKSCRREPEDEDPARCRSPRRRRPSANTFNLELSPRAGVWTHDRQLNDQTVTAVGSLRGRISPSYGALDGYAEGFVQAVSEQGWSGDLVEAWMRVTSGNFEVKAGREIVVWGRADGLNPTDIISSRDYTLLVADDEEQRRGNMMIQAPPCQRRLYHRCLLAARVPAQHLSHRYRAARRRHRAPTSASTTTSSSRFKIDRSGGSHRLVAVLVPRHRPHPRFRRAARNPAGLAGRRCSSAIRAIDMFGADLAGTAGRIGYRAEVAFTSVKGPDTIYRKNSNVWFVAGIDTTLDNGWHINLQYSFRFIFDYQRPARHPRTRSSAPSPLQSAAVNNQLTEIQNGVTFSASKAFLQDTLTLQLQSVVYFESANAAIMPMVTYAINDRGAPVGRGRHLSGTRTQLFRPGAQHFGRLCAAELRFLTSAQRADQTTG